MKTEKWLKENTRSLSGKTVAVTGTTGGLGKELCRYLAHLGASLILVDRNPYKSQEFAKELLSRFSGVSVECINIDLSDFASVCEGVKRLKSIKIDIFIHNAGAYNIPRFLTDIGYDNVFQINFVSPYYIIKELLPLIRQNKGKIISVGSIAHNYSISNSNDIDFRNQKRASMVYGNAKRYLMFSLFELFKGEERATLSITHPGITFTNITAHYPKLIFSLIKHPMKVIFMKPETACLSILKGVFEHCGECEWIGPRFFNVWGKPKKKLLKTCDSAERKFIGETAEKIYKEINDS